MELLRGRLESIAIACAEALLIRPRFPFFPFVLATGVFGVRAPVRDSKCALSTCLAGFVLSRSRDLAMSLLVLSTVKILRFGFLPLFAGVGAFFRPLFLLLSLLFPMDFWRFARRIWEFQWFLIELSVLPGKNLAIAAHLFPSFSW